MERLQRLNQVISQRDFKKNTLLVALDLIWAFTGLRFSEYHIKLGRAYEFDPFPDVLDDHNSFIEASVDSRYDNRFGLNEGFIYRRLPLNTIPGFEGLTVSPTGETFRTKDLLPQINDALDVELNRHDLLDVTYVNDGQPIVLQADPGSWAWIDSVTVKTSDQPILKLFETVYLDGFNTDALVAGNNPYRADELTLFVSLLNTTNQTQHVYGEDFTLGEPTPVSGDPLANTRIQVIPTDPQYVKQYIYYRRIPVRHLAEQPLDAIAPVPVPLLPFTTLDVLEGFNDAMGAALKPEVLANVLYDQPRAIYDLTIASPSKSLVWLAGTTQYVPLHPGQRQLENGWPRQTEDGLPRMLEA